MVKNKESYKQKLEWLEIKVKLLNEIIIIIIIILLLLLLYVRRRQNLYTYCRPVHVQP